MINIKPTYIILFAALLFMSPKVTAQLPLDNYIQEGLRNNLALQQKNLTLQQAEQSLAIARSFFIPSVTLLADYISGDGGRSIDIPVGNLLNPVYTTLNQLTSSNSFPQVENVKQNFFPNNFYDARVRTSVPLVNTDLYLNRTIRSQQVLLRQHEAEMFKRQLVADIKTAYFTYLMATQAVKIYESALLLVNKNVEINESMLTNGKGLPANHLRSKSEAEKVSAEFNGARNRQANARKYFNFLLNKELNEDIEESLIGDILADNDSMDISNREELKMLSTLQAINATTVRMNKLNHVPKVNAFIDLGSQAYDWRYDNQSRYYLFGVQLSLPLFQGFRNNQLVKQSKVEYQKSELLLIHTRNQLTLAAQVARNDLSTAKQNHTASEGQLKSAKSYFNLIEKGYQQGVNNLIEYLDARNQLTTSELQRSVRWFETLIAQARLERETAAYSFEPKN